MDRQSPHFDVGEQPTISRVNFRSSTRHHLRYERFDNLEGIAGSELWQSNEGHQALQRRHDRLGVIEFSTVECRQYPDLGKDEGHNQRRDVRGEIWGTYQLGG